MPTFSPLKFAKLLKRALDVSVKPADLQRLLDGNNLSIEQEGNTSNYLRSLNFKAETIFDVGVHNGTPYLYNSFPNAKIVMIDPMAESRVRSEKWQEKFDTEFHNVAVGRKAGKSIIRTPIFKTSGIKVARSSIQEISDDDNAIIHSMTRIIDVDTLDNIAQGHTAPFGLKIDTEGYELEVIKGARDFLKSCEFVIAEVSMKRRFVGGYLFSDFVTLMSRRGFEVLEALTPVNKDRTSTDLLFVRVDSGLLDSDEGIE